MFGYIRTDTPYLYIKDQTLYRAMYCGLCKGIAKSCGQVARFALTYDVTFFSVLLHNIAGTDVKIEKGKCVAHCLGKKRPMAGVDTLTEQLGAFNTVLAYFKFKDDVEDGDGGKARKALLKKGYTRAKKNYPEIERIVRETLAKQSAPEKEKTSSVDYASDATACLTADISDCLLADKRTPYTRELFYAIGKWIYLIDALDDFDKDKKKGNYNPFVCAYDVKDGKELLEKYGTDVDFVFRSLFYDLRENASHVRFAFNRDLVDNVLVRGIPAETERVKERLRQKNKKRKEKDGNAVRKE